MSSYDMSKGAYVLDVGEYAVKLGKNVHDIEHTERFEITDPLK